MKHPSGLPQFFLRIALGIGFLAAVGDRIGWLGPSGSSNIAWGNWDSFIDYTGTLMPFLERPAVNILGSIASVAEVVIGILLIIGFKTKLAAISSCVLTLIFAIAMTVFLGIKAPINYAVLCVCSASLLLATLPVYEWSIDKLLQAKKSKV